jgi:hypothetical protein
MSQYAAIDGAPTDWHLVHLGKFARGGAGIVFVEDTTVEERARKTYHCPGIYFGSADPLALLPQSYAWWLRRREEVRKLYPTGEEESQSAE